MAADADGENKKFAFIEEGGKVFNAVKVFVVLRVAKIATHFFLTRLCRRRIANVSKVFKVARDVGLAILKMGGFVGLLEQGCQHCQDCQTFFSPGCGLVFGVVVGAARARVEISFLVWCVACGFDGASWRRAYSLVSDRWQFGASDQAERGLAALGRKPLHWVFR